MKTDVQNIKRLSIAWLVAGIAFLAVFIGVIFFICEAISLALLFCLIPLGYAVLTIAWRLTVKRARTVSSVIFVLFTLACLALAVGLLWLIALSISLHPVDAIFPAGLLVCLIVWYVLFFILRKKIAYLIEQKERPDEF